MYLQFIILSLYYQQYIQSLRYTLGKNTKGKGKKGGIKLGKGINPVMNINDPDASPLSDEEDTSPMTVKEKVWMKALLDHLSKCLKCRNKKQNVMIQILRIKRFHLSNGVWNRSQKHCTQITLSLPRMQVKTLQKEL